MPRLGDLVRLVGCDTEHGKVQGLFLNPTDDVYVSVYIIKLNKVESFTLEEFNTIFKII